MVKSKKKNTTKSKYNKNDEKKISIDFLAIIFISIGVISIVAAYTDSAGALSIFTRNYLYKIFGILIFLVPLIFVYLGVMMWVHRDEFTFSKYVSGPIFTSLGIAIIASTFIIHSYNIESTNTLMSNILFKFKADIHGGIIVSFVTFYLTKLIGFICSYVISALMILYGLIKVSNKDIREIVTGIQDAAFFIIDLFKKIPVPYKVLEFLGLKDPIEEDLVLNASNVKHKSTPILKDKSETENDNKIELEIVERGRKA